MLEKEIYKDITHFTDNDVQSIIVCGDIHGQFSILVNKICCQYGVTDALVIVAGDCGFGFERPGFYEDLYRRKLRKHLEKNNVSLLMVRGNHDNPYYFKEPFMSDYADFPRMKTVPDYGVIEACGKTILCVGGGVSVDRTGRGGFPNSGKNWHGEVELKPAFWWPGEFPVYNEELLSQVNERFVVDTIVTHTAPSFCEKSSKDGIKSWLENDENLRGDLEHERLVMDLLDKKVKEYRWPVTKWIYGHFHWSWQAKIDGITYMMLNELELKELY